MSTAASKTPELDAAISGFAAGAMWAARELGQPDSEAAAWFERAQRAAREVYKGDGARAATPPPPPPDLAASSAG